VAALGGRPPKTDRIVVTAIWQVLRTGCPWRDVPERHGPRGSIHTRWRRWCASGLWPRLRQCLARRHLDCSHIKLHQAGPICRVAKLRRRSAAPRVGSTTKPAAVVDRHGRAVAVWLALGPQHDLHAVEPLRPAVRQHRLVADKGFDADSFRARLRHQHTQCCIPP
jgi:transposase